MNTQRVLILGVAALAAGAAVLLVRGLLGGGTARSHAALPPPAVSEVLVASGNLQAGAALTPASVRWQEWPKSAVDASFITRDTAGDPARVVRGAVARAPIMAGEPLTAAKIVHGDSAGFMAAMVDPGMRAVSIGISTETGAGGFILPNDRVDVLVTQQISDSPRRFATHTLFTGVRVLAVDQTYREDQSQKVVLAKTATLELTPHQAEQVEGARASGTLSLSLRALGDDGAHQVATADKASAADTAASGAVTVIGYGIAHAAGNGQGE